MLVEPYLCSRSWVHMLVAVQLQITHLQAAG
jgi:hypothetical protein